MKKMFALLLLTAIVMFPACNSSTGNNDNNNNNNGTTGAASTYLPFKIGNSWTFNSTDASGTSTYTETIIGNATINGNTYWLSRSLDAAAVADTTYYRVADNTLYSFFDISMFSALGGLTAKNAKIAGAFKSAQSALGPEAIVAKFGVSVGTTWTIYDITLPTSETINVKGKFVGLEKVQTAAGTFANCAKFEITAVYTSVGISMNTTSNQWYATAVGPVKININMETNYAGQKITFSSSDVLKSYIVQ